MRVLLVVLPLIAGCDRPYEIINPRPPRPYNQCMPGERLVCYREATRVHRDDPFARCSCRRMDEL